MLIKNEDDIRVNCFQFNTNESMKYKTKIPLINGFRIKIFIAKLIKDNICKRQPYQTFSEY